MAKKNECYLCGGKLQDGYCPECGLDNTKMKKRHFHLNESSTVESMNGDTDKASEKCAVKTGQENRNESELYTEKKNIPQKNKKKSQDQNRYRFRSVKPAGSAGRMMTRTASSNKTVKVAAVVLGLAIVLGLIGDYAEKRTPDLAGRGVYESETKVENDPYGYVENELADTGEHYEAELKQGDYLVGVHLPEGAYTAERVEGTGGLSVDDYENGIYLWQSFGTEEEYGEVESMEDIRLYNGARIKISDAVCLRLTTENGQTEEMESIGNPLTEAVALKKDKTMIVGEDISPGVYDLSVMFNWAIMRCRVPDDAYEEGYYEKSYWLSGADGDDTYRNVYLKEGVVITAEENSLDLTPSPVIGSGEYEDYYRYYD